MKKRFTFIYGGFVLAAFSCHAQNPQLASPTPTPFPVVGHGNPLEDNKAVVVAFYELAFNQHRPTEAAKKYVGDEYIQHNPHVPNGAAAFYEHFEAYFKEHPKSHVVFSHVVAEGDLVVLHLNSKVDEKDRGEAIVDVFRLENGKIVEHWDVHQDVPEKTASGNPMF